MWALLSSKLRGWLLIAVGVPALAWLLKRASGWLEARAGGQTSVSRSLQRAGGWLQRKQRRPFARRHRGNGPDPQRATLR